VSTSSHGITRGQGYSRRVANARSEPYPATLEAGTEIGGGRYRVGAPISRGAMGAVHRAVDTGTGEEVAVKRLVDLTKVARFDIESRLLSCLSHPRIVRVIDHFKEASGYYLVMELVRGPDLGTLLAQDGAPGLPVPVVLDYAQQACEALFYVHSQRIVHRDVKPQNLILGYQGVVLVDFGVARELGEETGTAGVGTPRFMAPEILAGGAVSERSDVFSLAATISTLIAGKVPTYGKRHALRHLPGVTPQIDDALSAGMEFMPDRRIASIDSFARALGRPLEQRGGSSLGVSVPNESAAPSLMEAVVRTAAGVFDAAAASIALTDRGTEELVYLAAWGAGAREIVGVRLPRGEGIAGSVVVGGEAVYVAECRTDPRFAAAIAGGTGYVPITMLVVPLKRGSATIGALSLLDRRDGLPYSADDVSRATLFAELAVAALEHGSDNVLRRAGVLGQREPLP
jgi:hypothetical protein